MARPGSRISPSEVRHVLGRVAMAVAIGWGYVAAAIVLNLAESARVLRTEPWGPVLIVEIFIVVGVMFGVTGARIGAENVGLVPARRPRRG